MDKEKTLESVNQYWDSWYVAGVSDFIRIPNLSPMCDPNYTTNGLLEQAIDLVDSYIQKLEIVGLERKIFKPEGMLPLVVYVVQPSQGQTRNIMMYGHLDKQPYEEAWAEGLGPITPVVKDGKLYGRGGADDGYSSFSAMLAVKTAQL